MKTTSLFFLIGAIGISTLAGCGGNVVVEPPGGNGGADGAGGAGGSTSSTSTGTTTTTPTNPEAYCTDYCTQNTCLSQSVPECVDSCTIYFAFYPECISHLVAVNDCLLETAPTYGCSPDGCVKEGVAWLKCLEDVQKTCVEFGCGVGPDGCFCDGECDYKYLVADCKSAPNGNDVCTCYAEGTLVGSCQGPNVACSLVDGCCAQYFFPEDG